MAWLTSLLSVSFIARLKFASALLRVISAIFSLRERRPLLAVCELVSNVFHVRSLVAAKVSNASLLDADLHQVTKRVRHLRLHERVIGHVSLLCSQLPSPAAARLVPACGLLTRQQPVVNRPPSSPPKALDQQA